MSELSKVVRDRFPGQKILIIGDLVADQFLHGTISRVSREAPVFILNHDSTDTRAGAAANAAVNVAALGALPMLIGFLGTDTNGDLLIDTLRSAGVDISGIVRVAGAQTTTKVRVLAGQHYAARQQVIRIDYENRSAISHNSRAELIENVTYAASDAAAIILSDYNYGVVGADVFEIVRKVATDQDIPLLVDSRFQLAEFAGATTATPNSDEVEQILGKDFTDHQCGELRESLGLEALLITRGNKGMQLFQDGMELRSMEAVGATEPVDVTGAGDTVIAAYAVGLAAGLSFYDAASIANHAGGLVVMKKGTAFVTPAELIDSINEHASTQLSSNA
ncbi:MAG TPA: PfkB family carbohydrate kinase [Pyrinomonadaceae bacterium]|nr:PfkB family carbohydrate kinase [Pyrinomonadaceae bacterium]